MCDFNITAILHIVIVLLLCSARSESIAPSLHALRYATHNDQIYLLSVHPDRRCGYRIPVTTPAYQAIICMALFIAGPSLC